MTDDQRAPHVNMTAIAIYGLFDPMTQELRYVGYAQDARSRLREHIGEAERPGRGTIRCNWIRSLIARGLRPDLDIIEVVDDEHVADAERFWIGYFRSIGCSLTNMTLGGDGVLGYRWSEELKARLSVIKRRQPGHPHTAEHRAALRGNKHALGLRHTQEARAKMSAFHKGRPKSEEHRAKISESGRLTRELQRAAR